jgi:PAS domain S-box-containing protein
VENARLYQEIQIANEDLEKRVVERTRELQQANDRLLREVEERRKTEVALQKSEVMLASLFEAAPDATVLVDLAGRIVRVNRQAETLFGYERDELVGSPVDRLIPPRLRGSHTRKRLRYLQQMVNRAMGEGSDLYALRKDRSEFPVEIMLNPVQTEQGEMIICAIRDRTEQKRLQAELAEIHRRLYESIEAERLTISQELHDGPIQELYAIGIYLETLKDLLTTSRDADDLLQIKRNVQGIIQSLRGICGDLRPPTLNHFGLEKSIRSHLAHIRETHPELAIETHLMSDGSRLSERARLALYRVYQNAVSNTIRHAGATLIRVTFKIEEGEVFLSIQDNGKGFARPRKWVDLAREGHFGLVGMIERVESIGGTLEIDSAPGKGTLLRVTVPLEQPVIAEVGYH